MCVIYFPHATTKEFLILKIVHSLYYIVSHIMSNNVMIIMTCIEFYLFSSLPYHHVKLMFVGWSGRGKTTLLKKLTEKGQTSVISSWHGHSENFKDKNTPIIRHWTCSIPSSLRSQCKIKRITFKTWDFPSLVRMYVCIRI